MKLFAATWGLALITLSCATLAPIAPTGDRRIVSAVTGEVAVDAATVVRDLSDVAHVYVGEHHDSASDHAVQVEVAEAMRSSGRPLVVGVEWLPAAANPALADWVEGRLDEAAFLRTVDWERVWGHSAALYRPIFEWARRHSVRMVGLNPPPGLAEAVGRGRPLSAEQTAVLPPLTSGYHAHREAFAERFLAHAHAHGHGHPFRPETLERYYKAQLVRDETMALAVIAEARPGGTVLVFAGAGHVDHGFGVPERAAGLAGPGLGPFRIVLPVPSGELPDRAQLVTSAPYPTRRADWLWEAPRAGGALALWTGRVAESGSL